MAIEFSRNITFGQYLDLGSPIHRLDPRIKIVGAGALMFATIAARGFGPLGVLCIAIVLIQLFARLPLGYTLRGLRVLVIPLIIFAVFQILFFRNPTNPWWQWGFVSLSLDGILLALQTTLRSVMLYYLTTTLMYTTSLVDLADGVEVMLDPLKRFGLPINELVMTMVVALKFVPLLVAELERLIKAQAARGASIDRGGLTERARNLGAVLVPLFVGALARAEVLTTAMDARCYRGGRGRTKRRVLTLQAVDLLALALALLIVAASVVVGRLA
jgi:energy-coupling factor transport system permease protein